MLIGKGQWKGGRGGIWWDAARRRWIGWGGGIGVFNWIEGLLSFTSFILNFSYLSVSPIFTLLGSSNLSKELQINVKFLEVLRLFFFLFFLFFNFTILYGFCHISTWIRHRYTCVPHPEPSSLLPLHTIPLGRASTPAPSIQYRASNLDWWLISYMILFMFQCHSPKSFHPLPLPQSPKDCSIHQCLFCCLVYRVIVTIFLNSIYMR